MVAKLIFVYDVINDRITRWIRDENDLTSSKGNIVENLLLDMGGNDFIYLNILMHFFNLI